MNPNYHDPVEVIWPYTRKKLNGKNLSAFEFSFMTHLIKYNLKEVFCNDVGKKARLNKVHFILIAAPKSSQFVLVYKISTSSMVWLALKSFYQKESKRFVLLYIQKFWHTKMMLGEDLYEHLTTMWNLADKLEEVTRTNITEEDFITTFCFSIKGIWRYSNIIEIIINDLVLQRAKLINKLTSIQGGKGEAIWTVHRHTSPREKRKKKKEKHMF